MATALRLRRGTTTQHGSFTGLEGEVTVDTTKDTVVVHDGSTAGGFPLAKETGSTVAVANGTVSAPGLTTSGDTNTGIFFPAADTIAFAEGGAEAMRINSSGNVLINTTSSVSIGVVNPKLQIEFTDYDASSVIKRNQNDTGGPTGHFIKSRGTTNGSNTVVQSGDTLGQFRFWGTDGTDPAEGASIIAQVDGTPGNNDMPGRLIFSTTADGSDSPTERMRIDSSGNLGLGSTSPSTFDDANGGRNLVLQSTGTQRGVITFASQQTSGADNVLGIINFIDSDSTNTNYRGARILGMLGSDANSAYLRFDTANSAAGTERMRIDSSGNVGIGQTSPTAKLHVKSGSNSDSTAVGIFEGATSNILQVGYGSVGAWFNVTAADPLQFKMAGTERARITSGGYFKASNDGTYNGSTGAYHELRQTANDATFVQTSTNASLASVIQVNKATRSATSSYIFLRCESNAGSDIEFDLKGDGNGYADGTWNNNGADYAEFFESANGQALTLGATVVLDGNKVREATDQDPASAIIGVVRPKEPSKASMVVGNTAWNKWANKYLTDDFDRYIMEDHDVVEWEEQVLEREAVAAVEAVVDEEGNEVSPAVPAQEAVYKTKQHSYESHNIPAGVTVPTDAVRKAHDDKGNKFQHYKLNPAWDKDAEYVNRENRPEWNIIGLLGQVKILKGQPVGDRWVKMRDVSATVEEWMIR